MVAAQRALDALQTEPKAAALFDFDQLKVARNLQLRDIKSVNGVMRARVADIAGDMVIDRVEQHEPSSKKKKQRRLTHAEREAVPPSVFV